MTGRQNLPHNPPQSPLQGGRQGGQWGRGGPGEARLRKAIHRHLSPRAGGIKGGPARRDAPQPYDDDWGWWIEQRLTRLESGQKWLIGLAISTLVATILKNLVPI